MNAPNGTEDRPVDLVAFIEKEVLPDIDYDDDVMGTHKAVVIRALIAEVRQLRIALGIVPPVPTPEETTT